MDEVDLRSALLELGDEPAAARIARAILAAREEMPIVRTIQLASIVQQAVGAINWRLHPHPKKWQIHPAARTFQVLRLLVNRELGNLGNLLRVLPRCLLPGGTTVIISFHSGEDRLVKNEFRKGLGRTYEALSKDPIRPVYSERQANPRSRSAKLRWARVAPASLRTIANSPSQEKR
jgi:16S rRNA (cytosine1402-N4)-methyltransferase